MTEPDTSRTTCRRRTIGPLAVLLAVHATLLLHSIHVHSETVDEGGHVVSGLHYWKSGHFNLYRVNPPLIKLLASLPVVASQPKVAFDTSYAPDSSWVDDHLYLVHNNRGRYHQLIRRARCVIAALSVLTAMVIYKWSSEVYGTAAGFLGAFIWCAGPNVLAWAGIANTDVGSAAIGIVAAYVFRQWLNRPFLTNAVVAGWLLGLAQLSKFTLIVLYPAFGLIVLVSIRQRFALRGDACRDGLPSVRRIVWGSAIGFVVSIAAINAGYGFEGTGRALGDFKFASHTLAGRADTPDPNSSTASGESPSGQPVNRFRGSWMEHLPVPLPEQYLLGLDEQKSHSDYGYHAYLAGEWKHGGWWYYYLYAAAIKVPLGTWLLGGLAALLACSARFFRSATIDELCAVLPALFMGVLISSQSGVNGHFRYLIPAFPFLAVAVSRVGRLVEVPRRGAAMQIAGYIALTGIAWTGYTTIRTHPHHLSYFNEVAGGAENGWRYLADFNIDAGQDLLFLKEWLSDNMPDERIGLAYYGPLDPAEVGIDHRLPPVHDAGETARWNTGDESESPLRWHAVSVNFLCGKSAVLYDGAGQRHRFPRYAFSYFQMLTPVARAGPSILLYRADRAELERAMQQWRLARDRSWNASHDR